MQGRVALLYETRLMLQEVAGLPEASSSRRPAPTASTPPSGHGVLPRHRPAQADRRVRPDNAHGTNPASCAMCGANVVAIKTVNGYTDIDALKKAIDDAALRTSRA